MIFLLLLREGGSGAVSASGMPVIKSSTVPSSYWDAVVDQRGIMYLVNGIDRPVAWNGLDAAVRNWGIDAPTSAPSTTEGAAASNIGAGTYHYTYGYVNKNVSPEVVSNPSPSASRTTSTAKKILVKFSATVPDSQVTHKRLFRSTNGQNAVLYKLTDVSATVNSYTDDVADATVSANDVMDTDHDVPSAARPFVDFHQGRVHLFGSRVENTGTIAIAGKTVTGTSTTFRASHAGQTLVTGTTERTISSFTSSTSIKLTASATVSSGASYAITPGISRNQWSWSKAGEPEYFPTANSTNVYESDGDEPTGTFVLGGILYATKRSHVYAMVFANDPNPITGDGGIYPALHHRGATNNRCIVVAGTVAYILDEKGIYAFDGASASEIDTPVNRLIVPSTEGSTERVSWPYRELFHGVYDPKRNRVLFFVCIGTDTRPKHAFTYDILRQRWSLEEYQQAITSSGVMEDADGKMRAWVGDENGFIWALGVSGSVDGSPPEGSSTVRGTVTSSTSTTITDSSATFYTTGDSLKGVPLYILGGTGAGQWRIISQNTATQLTVSSAWTTTPDTTSTYLVGAVESILRTKWFPSVGPKGKYRALRIYFEPYGSEALLRVKLYLDFSGTAYAGWQKRGKRDSVTVTSNEMQVSLNDAKGYVEVPIGDIHCRFLKVELRVIDASRKPEVLGYELVGEQEAGSERLK